MPFHPNNTRTTCLRRMGNDCSLCADNCPGHAISLSSKVEIDTSKCLLCGICASVCPTRTIAHPVAAKMVSHIRNLPETAAVSVGCYAIPFTSRDTLLFDGCLSSINLESLALIAFSGVLSITFVHGECSQCDKGDQCHTFQKALTDLRKAFPELGEKLHTAKKKSAKTADRNAMSRRGLFNLFSARRFLEPTESQPLPTSGTLPPIPLDRSQLVKDMRLQTHPERLLRYIPNAMISIDDTCTGCATCSRVCPTDAVEFIQRGKTYCIRFTAWKCLDCGLCEKTCLPHSIKRSDPDIEFFLTETPLELTSGHLMRCKRCEAPSSMLRDGYCPVCAEKLGI